MILYIYMLAFGLQGSDATWSLRKATYVDFYVEDTKEETFSFDSCLLVSVVFGITLSCMGLYWFWFSRRF